jgi:uncharacterized protein (TIGR03435 family)
MRDSFAIMLLVAGSIWAQSGPAFEVASVKVTPPGSRGFMSVSGYGTNRYTMTNGVLALFVQLAYEVQPDQIQGIDKLGTEHYDLSVKAEDGIILTNDQLAPRLARLLAERFKLVVHHEPKVVDGYALTVAKGGSKLVSAGAGPGGGTIFPGGLRLTNYPLNWFATALRSPAGRPVVDKTDITGNYDFDLKYAADNDTDSALPSFFTALQEKYGLKLETAKVPLDFIVIDSVEKIPSEN